jgi:hypothetical protein
MAMQKMIALTFAAAMAATTFPVLSHAGAQSSSVFIPPSHNRENQSGEHYDTVQANYMRRCASLDGQFTRLRANMASSSMLQQASALHDQGVAHCNGGARLQGIDELTAAIRQIGGIPRVEL